MKKLSLLAALCLMSACVSTNTKSSSVKNDASVVGFTVETHGLTLEYKTDQRVALKVEWVSANAKFKRLVPILPGENMQNGYQSTAVTASEDYIIGINGNIGWKSQDELLNAVTEAYKNNKMVPLHVINVKTGRLQHVVAGDDHSLNDLSLSSATLTINVSSVKDVQTKSWAEKNGLLVGDEIIGAAQFRSATIRRSRIPLLDYNRNETKSQEASGGEASAVQNFFDVMFEKIAPWQPAGANHNGLMGAVGLVRVTVARGSVLMHKDLSHSRYVGLGVLFSCTPYCGNAKPEIKAMRENSAGARAGLKLDDMVWSVNGKRVYNSWDTTKKLRKLNYGDAVALRVLREGRPVDIITKIDWVIED